MIYGLTNSKGGVGKTTISVHLAAWLAKGKRPVIFIDADPQQSASTWIKELGLPIRLEQISEPEGIIQRVSKMDAVANDIVIDGPAGLSATTRAIMLKADKVFLPCGPSILDLRAAIKAVEVLRKAQKTRKGKPTGILVPNKLHKRLPFEPGDGDCCQKDWDRCFGRSFTAAKLRGRSRAGQSCLANGRCLAASFLGIATVAKGDDPWVKEGLLVTR
ncbi:MAG: ParA family protein [Chthoniobacteraceae bacterium]